jgi:hypothetical protein
MDGKRREYKRKEWIRMDGTGMDGKGIDGKGLDGKEMEGNALKGNGLDGNGMERKRKEWKKITSLQSEVMGICTLMPHLLGVLVWDGGASAPEGADALCPHHLDILLPRRAASRGRTHIM